MRAKHSDSEDYTSQGHVDLISAENRYHYPAYLSYTHVTPPEEYPGIHKQHSKMTETIKGGRSLLLSLRQKYQKGSVFFGCSTTEQQPRHPTELQPIKNQRRNVIFSYLLGRLCRCPTRGLVVLSHRDFMWRV